MSTARSKEWGGSAQGPLDIFLALDRYRAPPSEQTLKNEKLPKNPCPLIFRAAEAIKNRINHKKRVFLLSL
jgi:hypothetical protein